jgi:hypothetical protein
LNHFPVSFNILRSLKEQKRTLRLKQQQEEEEEEVVMVMEDNKLMKLG